MFNFAKLFSFMTSPNKQTKQERERQYKYITFARPLPPEQTNKVKGHELP